MRLALVVVSLACLQAAASCAGKPPEPSRVLVVASADPAPGASSAPAPSSAPSSPGDACYGNGVARAVTACPAKARPEPSLAAIGDALLATHRSERDARRREPPSRDPLPLRRVDTDALDLTLAYRCAPRDAGAIDPEVAYARARLYFERQHWAEAAVLFEEIALAPAQNPNGVYAAQLWLESLNVIATLPKGGATAESACLALMGDGVARLTSLYCATPPPPARSDGGCACVCGDALCSCAKEPCTPRSPNDNREFCELLARVASDLRKQHH